MKHKCNEEDGELELTDNDIIKKLHKRKAITCGKKA
jgi:hypothetical protein